MSFKILISSLPNVGKTTLCKSLDPKTTLVIARDGKKYPLALPARTIDDFTDADDLIAQINDAISVFMEKFKVKPKTIVIDSISKIFLDIESRVLERVKSFPYGVITTEISKLMSYVEHTLSPHVNIIYISHAEFDADTNTYKLINAGGSWGKKGGVISEVDQAIFLELKNKKRIVHHKSSHMLSRTTCDDISDSQPIEEFSLKEHLEFLDSKVEALEEFTL